MKKSILLATSALLASSVAVSAQAIDVELYGQVNKAVVGADIENDGRGANVSIVDNDISSTRFGLRGNHQLDNGLTASVLLEGELEDNASDSAVLADNVAGAPNTAGAGSAWSTRHARVGIGGNWGAVFLGHTSSATDGVAEIDLSAAQDVSSSAADRIGGGIVVGGQALRNYADNIDGIGYTGSAVSGLLDQHDNDRDDLVRYDSPIVAGVQARVAYVQGGDVDAALLYNNTFGGFEVAAGAGYVAYDQTAPRIGAAGTAVADTAYSLTASVKHDSGVSATASWGKREFDGKAANEDNPESFYAKLGYQYNNTGVAIDYTKNEDAVVSSIGGSSELDAYGIYVQQDLGHGVSASAFYKQVETELNNVDNEDLSIFGVNMRVKF